MVDIKINGEWCVAGSRPSGPGPGQQLPAHPIQLADVAPPEAAQERPQGGGRLDHATESASRPAGAQHVGVVNAVAPSQRGCHQGPFCRPGSPRPGRISEVNVVVQTDVAHHLAPVPDGCVQK